MTPIEFENSVAEEYRAKGYEVRLTSKSYDYGVDVIAVNETESLAIQVKMYESRLVNYKDIMYLFAGMHYYDCTRALLITQGILDPNAKKVCQKLRVYFIENYASSHPIDKPAPVKAPVLDFDTIWNAYIMPLQGRKLMTGSGKVNEVTKVTGDYLYRRSSTGEESKIEKAIFRTIYYRLKETKEITRSEINTEYSKRASAMITAVLGQVPFITMLDKPVIKLVWTK